MFSFSYILYFPPLEDSIMRCTFDLVNEICPLKNKNDWQIQKGSHFDQTRPISDHTRGGKNEIFLRLIFIYLFQ